MSPTTHDNDLDVDDLVSALTQVDDPEAAEPDTLREQIARAAEDYAPRTAQAAARVLLDGLCEAPSDVRRLEALLLLGLAHPKALEKQGVALGSEGRRLALLLEQAGQVERARSLLELLAGRLPDDGGIDQDLAGHLRRTGCTDELVERYLRRASENVARGRDRDAIVWLQEALLLDRNRRDVPRLIRDLRTKESQRKHRFARALRAVVLILLLSSLGTLVTYRERELRAVFRALPPVDGDTPAALHARLDVLQGMLDENKAWLGMLDVLRERRDLRQRVDELAAERLQEQERALRAAREATARAEELRAEGMRLARVGEMSAALEQLTEALRLAAPDWPHRARVEADVAAIQAWKGRPR